MFQKTRQLCWSVSSKCLDNICSVLLQSTRTLSQIMSMFTLPCPFMLSSYQHSSDSTASTFSSLRVMRYLPGHLSTVPYFLNFTSTPLIGNCTNCWALYLFCSCYGNRTFAAAGPRLWNSLPAQLRNPNITCGLFRRQLKGHFFWEPWSRRSVTSDM